LIAIQQAPAPTHTQTPLTDRFGRRIDHLRISVTRTCDLRCVYCRPAGGIRHVPCRGDLSDAQRVAFVRFLHERHGLRQVRITGGEPLLYGSLLALVDSIKGACPDLTLAITTNGRLLARHARALRAAGVDRLNVSVDSLDEACYRKITGGRLSDCLQGLDAACAAGFPPPKLNTVVLRDLNDGELVDLATWGIARGSEIRFLEAMPIGPARTFNDRHFVAVTEVRRRLSASFILTPMPTPPGATAQRFCATHGTCSGIIGTIAPVTEPFCGSCRRIRLTADGRLFPCLLDRCHVDLHAAWSDGRFDPAAAAGILGSAVTAKAQRGQVQHVEMVQLGG